MVNIPFVSENFQRSFRNRFPSQTSTGRDLHVSDVVIPVVDFTPTASGTSLPRDLQEAFDYTTTAIAVTGETGLVTTPGFWKINFSYSGDFTSDEAFAIFIKDDTTGVNYTVFNSASTVQAGVTTYGQENVQNFFVFLQVGYSLRANASGNHRGRVQLKQVADVNGNIILPTGYSPQ